MPPRISPAVAAMDESVIREMTRVAEDQGAVNLAQGFPEYPIPGPVLEAAHRALDAGHNRYTRTWGDPLLRREVTRFLRDRWGLAFDPETEVVITCGASEAIMAALLALLSPGDTAVVAEPIYENYLPGIRLAGARPAVLRVDPFTGHWDEAELERALRGARVMVLNTPTNPTGKVWTREELSVVADLVARNDTLLITDETYAFITEPGRTHVPPASVGGLAGRTVTITSFSKTYAVTGWRVGFAAAPAPIMAAIRKAHDFLTVCAPAPFQLALVEALRLPESYYEDLRMVYRRRYELLAGGLSRCGWRVNHPQGTYFLLVDLTGLGIEDDRAWAVELACERGVAGVPGSAFLSDGMPRPGGEPPDRRGRFLRFSFGKREALLQQAIERLGPQGTPTSP
jgi:aspartate/methionine/tyrosine aminotransferase